MFFYFCHRVEVTELETMQQSQNGAPDLDPRCARVLVCGMVESGPRDKWSIFVHTSVLIAIIRCPKTSQVLKATDPRLSLSKEQLLFFCIRCSRMPSRDAHPSSFLFFGCVDSVDEMLPKLQ